MSAAETAGAPAVGTLAGPRPVAHSAWWAAALLLFAAAFGTNVSTPLLLVYRHELHLSPSTLTAIFGVYALGLAPSLLIGAPASDRFGRTRLLLPAVLLAGVASMLFIPGAHSVVMLFIARFVQGLASGAVFSIGSAWLQDLTVTAGAGVAARRASLALTAGFCLGPLSGGLLGQYGPRPLTLPYLVHAALVLVLVVAARVVARSGAWTAGRTGDATSGLWPRVELDAARRRFFRQVLIPTAVCVYAFPSVAVTVLPLLLRGQHHVVAFTGLQGAVALGSGALVQPWAHRFGERRAQVGVGLGALGYLLGVLATDVPSVSLVFVAGAVLGIGGGLCLNAGLVAVQRLSTTTTRGAANGLFYAWAYVGFAMPFLSTSFCSVAGSRWPLLVLTVATALTSVWVALRNTALSGA